MKRSFPNHNPTIYHFSIFYEMAPTVKSNEKWQTENSHLSDYLHRVKIDRWRLVNTTFVVNAI